MEHSAARAKARGGLLAASALLERSALLTREAAASSVPVGVLESQPPSRLVTRVSATEQQFGGTWTITIAPDGTGSALRVTEDGWVANPIFRVISRYIIGHHATMDAMLKNAAKELNVPAALSGS